MLFTGKYDFLSNFYEHPIFYLGHHFKTSEHAYQAMKADNIEDFNKVKNAPTPSHAKRLGREIKVRSDWNSVKVNIMRDILEIKFSDKHLAKRLIEIEEDIVEDNTWGDTYWGVCEGEGKNVLGKLLMNIREEIKYLEF